MIELALLALLHRLENWGLSPLIATRTVAADAATVHRLLSDPASQWLLAGSHAHDGAARVRPSSSERVISVELMRGARTVLWVTWILSAGRGSTEVDLAVQFETRGLATRLALVLGGRRWLARRVDAALGRLAQICARAAEDVAAPPAAADCAGRSRKKRRPARDTNRAGARPR